MDMLKYIVKRLLLALLILFGVSIIIYGIARTMPTDYIDNQYSSAVSQGTMTQEDVDRIKELYGLAMPDAFLSFTPGESDSEFAGVKFTKDTKADTHDQIVQIQQNGGEPMDLYINWYVGSYDASHSRRLYLNKDGTYSIGIVEVRGASVKDTEGEENADDTQDGEDDENSSTIISIDEVFTEKERGTYQIVEKDGLFGLVLIKGGVSTEATTEYRVATGGDQAKAILSGYFRWLGNMLKGDLGMSFKYKKPVADVILENMGISFAIALVATILQFLIAIPLGIKAAVHQYGVVDYTVTVLAMMGISLPTFFLGAIVIRVFAVQLNWFEVGGIMSPTLPMDASWIMRFGDILWHMVLPMFVLVILSVGGLMRYTRTNTLEALNADYVRTARAKGLSEHTVIYKHAFRNTMIPLVTMLAGILPSLFSGAMITETVFSIPGIGKMAYDALMVADIPFIMGYNMFIAILTVIGTLLSDLMYAVVDPRVKLGK